MKHANALESKNAWASIVKSLLYLIMIGTKKHGA
jgi:phage-related holin